MTFFEHFKFALFHHCADCAIQPCGRTRWNDLMQRSRQCTHHVPVLAAWMSSAEQARRSPRKSECNLQLERRGENFQNKVLEFLVNIFRKAAASSTPLIYSPAVGSSESRCTVTCEVEIRGERSLTEFKVKSSVASRSECRTERRPAGDLDTKQSELQSE